MSYAHWRNFEQGLSEQRASNWLLACLVVLTVVFVYRFSVLYAFPYTLYQEEAMYWDWSQQLSWGYFEKPPLLAWMIATTTHLFGNTEFAVRIGSVVLYPLVAVMVSLVARKIYGTTVAGLAGILFYMTPFVGISSIISHSDVYLLLFWASGLWAFLQAEESHSLSYGVLLGVIIGLGLLSQAGMLFFVLAVIMYVVFNHQENLIKQPWFITALVVSALCYAPCAWWNAQHGLPLVGRRGDWFNYSQGLDIAELLEVFAGQFAVYGPVLFAAILMITYKWVKRGVYDNRRVTLLACFTLLPLALTFLMALGGRVEANWAAASLVTACIILAEWIMAGRRWRLLAGALAINLAINMVVYHYEAVLRMISVPLSSEVDVYNKVRGWDELGQELEAIVLDNPGRGIISTHKGFIAQMRFYADDLSVRVDAWDPKLKRANHYQFISQLKDKTGQDFIFVARGETESDLAPYFESVELVGEIAALINNNTARSYKIYLANNLKGYPALAQNR